MEIDNWCNFTVCFSSKQRHICLFFVSHLWTSKLTESKNIFCISGRVACTIKLNIKETFMGNNGFLQRFMSWWTAVRQQNTYYLINILFTEGKKDSCYSLPTLGNPSTYFKQGLGYKVLQSIMTWYMTLLSVSYALQDAKKLLT